MERHARQPQRFQSVYYRLFPYVTQIRRNWGILTAMKAEDSAPPARSTDAPKARDAAVHLLASLHLGDPASRDSLDVLLSRSDIPPRERSLAHEFILGVVRHHLTLRHVISVLSGREWKNINRKIQPVLLIGAYQLIYLDRVPPFAAVHEAVEQAKRAGGPPAGRFVNAVLRRLDRDIEHRRIGRQPADPIRAIPVYGDACCQLRTPVLPDPGRQPIDHLALSTSHPIWLVSRWVSAFGLDQAREICYSGMCRPPLVLRPNRLRTDLNSLAESLRADGLDVIPDDESGVLILPDAAHITQSGAFRTGHFQMQDRTAISVVQAMDLKPGAVVIDLCSGPGTKTTQMAEIMNDTGTILASDKDDERLALVRENCTRLGVTCVRTVPPWEREAAFRALDRIDWILIDAPCSNTGVLARRPEARYRVAPRSLASLVSLQKELVSEAVRFARPRTRLAYSTCSLEPEENEGLLDWFGEQHPDWRVTAMRRTFPAAGQGPVGWRDGGFWAHCERR